MTSRRRTCGVGRWLSTLLGCALVLALGGCRTAPGRPAEPLPPIEAAPAPSPPPPPHAPTPTPAVAAPPVTTPAVRPPELAPPAAIRVLLQRGAGPALPQPGRRYRWRADDGQSGIVRGPIEATQISRSAFQVGAFADEANARALLERLGAAGLAARIVVSGGTSRVIAESGEAEDALAARLNALGLKERVRASGGDGARVVLRGEGGEEISARSVVLTPLDPDPVRVGAKSVRGDIVIRAGRSAPAVINLIDLETYLRGVVPAEMGPRAFPAIEALKAQAIAARTYTVAHLGGREAEGYDLCDTTMCQVYGGVEAEHPLSDTAVRETAGEVATYLGRPIDAMYHSTCAGHTEDAARMFPERAAPYLVGVPCTSERRARLGGSGGSGGAWVGGGERLAVVADAIAADLGVGGGAERLASRLGGRAAGRGVLGLAAAFGLGEPSATLLRGATSDTSVLDALRVFRLAAPEPGPDLPVGRWELAVVVRLAQLAGRVQSIAGRVVGDAAGPQLAVDGGEPARAIPASVMVLERRGERFRRAALDVPSGSPATLWLVDDAAIVLEVEPLEEADGRSSWTWWAREVPLAEMSRKLAIEGISSVEVLGRGVSGRALRVAVAGRDGRRELNAYRFRLTLGLPDTLFEVSVREAGTGPVARFIGRGWGHGIGLCQNGAYGMALAGASYREILARYYTGIEIVPLAAQTARGGDR